ncbi:unnamed protein product, partial [Rotaria magnacalcarata]
MEGAIVEEDDVADVQYMDIGEHELDCELDNDDCDIDDDDELIEEEYDEDEDENNIPRPAGEINPNGNNTPCPGGEQKI